jgi:hypothetical protein
MAPRNDEPIPTSIPQLSAALRGRVITPDDAGYDDARRVFSGEFDRRPSAIALVADEADVTRVVAFARENGLELAIRGMSPPQDPHRQLSLGVQLADSHIRVDW